MIFQNRFLPQSIKNSSVPLKKKTNCLLHASCVRLVVCRKNIKRLTANIVYDRNFEINKFPHFYIFRLITIALCKI